MSLVLMSLALDDFPPGAVRELRGSDCKVFFANCGVAPKRGDVTLYLLIQGQSNSWLLGNMIITITVSGCQETDLTLVADITDLTRPYLMGAKPVCRATQGPA